MAVSNISALFLGLSLWAVPPSAGTVRAGMKVNSFVDNDGNRILTPLTSVDVEVGENMTVGAHAAYDVMSCASVDVLSAATPTSGFEEVREEYGGQVQIRQGTWTLSSAAVYSEEYDYSSLTGTLGLSKDLAQRNTTLSMSYSFGDSNVGRAKDPFFERDMNSHVIQSSYTQVLSPHLISQLGYFVSVLDGYQSSPYRMVRLANGTAMAENTPDLRVRQATAVRLRWATTQTTFWAADYRFYFDSWGIDSHTLEVAFSQVPRRWLSWRLRTRLYLQSRADFYRSSYDSRWAYRTADRELGAFVGEMAGGKISIHFGEFLAFKALSMDFKVDGMLQRFEDFPQLSERLILVSEVGLSAAF